MSRENDLFAINVEVDRLIDRLCELDPEREDAEIAEAIEGLDQAEAALKHARNLIYQQARRERPNQTSGAGWPLGSWPDSPAGAGESVEAFRG